MSTTGEHSETKDATRRTRLAGERTQLAWWRTGLTALAVGVGVGRVVPSLDSQVASWPFEALGVAFSLYGAALLVFGNIRGRGLEDAARRGGYAAVRPGLNMALAISGVGLALATAALILFG